VLGPSLGTEVKLSESIFEKCCFTKENMLALCFFYIMETITGFVKYFMK
jgi:hypothetical protein